jgi:hypothetical protein
VELAEELAADFAHLSEAERALARTEPTAGTDGHDRPAWPAGNSWR